MGRLAAPGTGSGRGPGRWGGLLVLGMTLRSVLPGPLATFGARFFPPGHDAATRSLLMGRVLTDAAAGGLAALLLVRNGSARCCAGRSPPRAGRAW